MIWGEPSRRHEWVYTSPTRCHCICGAVVVMLGRDVHFYGGHFGDDWPDFARAPALLGNLVIHQSASGETNSSTA